MSLRLRLLVTLVPLFVLGLVAAGIGTYASLQSFLFSRVDEQILSAHQSVEGYLMQASGNGGSNGDRRGFPQGGSFPPGTYGELRSSTGTVIAQQTFGFNIGTSTHPILPATVTPGSQAEPKLFTVPGAGTVNRYRVYVDAVNDQGGGALVVGIPLDDVDATLGRLVRLEVGVTAVVTLVLALATLLIVRQSLRPLVRMGDTARSVVAHDLSRRIAPATEKTEVGRLGVALNTMLGQLEEAFAERAAGEQRLRHFVSDASHELRTPLTSMRGYAELLRRNPDMDRGDIAIAMRRIEEEARRMGVLVEDLLLLARLDQGRPLQQKQVDLESLVLDACADAAVSDPERRVSPHIEAPLIVTGDEMRLRQVLGNLVSNALAHTPAGTPVEVRLHSADHRAILEVVDHGPGIPPGAADRIFERFHRADPERSRDQGGSGLGLSIVAAVVGAHGGTVRVVPTPGGGATFQIALPPAGVDAAVTSRG